MKKKKMKFDSGQLPKYLIYAFWCATRQEDNEK